MNRRVWTGPRESCYTLGAMFARLGTTPRFLPHFCGSEPPSSLVSSKLVSSRLAPSRLALLGCALIGALLGGCAEQAEGERCDPLNYNQDCESGLTCTTLRSLNRGTEGAVCCDESNPRADVCKRLSLDLDDDDTATDDTATDDTATDDTATDDTATDDTATDDTATDDTATDDTASPVLDSSAPTSDAATDAAAASSSAE